MISELLDSEPRDSIDPYLLLVILMSWSILSYCDGYYSCSLVQIQALVFQLVCLVLVRAMTDELIIPFCSFR
jgi:hypothetical protein